MEVLLVPADPADPSGPEVVHKTATSPGERERLLREAEVLRTAADRGVAGLARVVTPPSAEAAEPTLVTSAVAGPSLTRADPLPVLEVAGVAAEVARHLGGLHDAGLVHGAVEPGHVVLDGAGGVILVGLGSGGEIGSPAVGGGDSEAGQLDPAGDVAGWGGLLSHLLDWSAVGEEEPVVAYWSAIGARRARRGFRRGSRQPSETLDEMRKLLASLADQAQNPDPAHRATARSFAAHVEHCVPGARVPGERARPAPPPKTPHRLLDRLSPHAVGASPAELAGDPANRPAEAGAEEPGPPPVLGTSPSTRRRPRWRRPVGVPFLAGGLDRSVGATPEGGTGRRATIVSAKQRKGIVVAVAACVVVTGLFAVAALSRQPSSSSARTTVARSAVKGCPPAAAPAADADGDGCEETVHRTGGVLQAGTARFTLGGPDDAWAVGDWDCDGRRTPALLHDGSLVVFDAWPGPGGELQGRRVATAPGARGLSVVVAPDGCERPAIARPGAADLLIDPRRKP